MTYSNGKSYGGRTYGEKMRWQKRSRTKNSRLVMTLNKELKIFGCWLFEFSYPKIGGENIHQKFARGEGAVVRHICGCNRCCQPYHLVKGTDLENAQDETRILEVGVQVLRSMCMEKYEGVTLDEVYLTLQSRVSRMKQYKFRSMSEVHQYIRERYRLAFEGMFPSTTEMDIDYLRGIMMSIVNFVEIKER